MFSKLATVFTIFSIAVLSVVAGPIMKRAFTGEGTYYTPGVGACGLTNTDADMIVAVSHLLYDSYPGATPNPNLNPICGKKLRANYNGRSVDVAVTDKCMGCAGMYDLDFTTSAILKLVDDPVAAGRLTGVTWDWL
ncbi:hypothetical protein CYLTODRAFT_416994 [Cylindrobasidium torrendii FP15055 ss-10]|uniref:RlpA-like protein double-psi beta-barrel domain-containing protein n=1 Tax=Cylindrobasidium torrendii FP15055 ss-10 TaxID=1314674 RepID=A0A0D7BTP0_9AGAR|nr:hypothetical protein CYLTODRAFT_416994 [Cylindrobasidium torrendii FP15055 ss-10]